MGSTLRRVITGLLQPGEYRRLSDQTKALIACPECGHQMPIGKEYTIARDGGVSPRYSCPCEDCPYLEFIFLESWGT